MGNQASFKYVENKSLRSVFGGTRVEPLSPDTTDSNEEPVKTSWPDKGKYAFHFYT